MSGFWTRQVNAKQVREPGRRWSGPVNTGQSVRGGARRGRTRGSGLGRKASTPSILPIQETTLLEFSSESETLTCTFSEARKNQYRMKNDGGTKWMLDLRLITAYYSDCKGAPFLAADKCTDAYSRTCLAGKRINTWRYTFQRKAPQGRHPVLPSFAPSPPSAVRCADPNRPLCVRVLDSTSSRTCLA